MKFFTRFFICLFILSYSCHHSESPETRSSSDMEEMKNESIISSQKQEGLPGNPIELNKEKFLSKVMNYEKNQTKWVFEGDIPCLIDFYADWCAPCRMTSPILDELAKEYKGKIHIYKINVDKEKELATVFGIRSIPTFIYCPLDENPQVMPSIANSPEQTKQLIISNIEKFLLKN